METLSRWRAARWRVAIVLACGAAALAVAQQASEATVKAALLFKFSGYVEWPPATFPAPGSPIVIGVAGADEIAAELERIVPGRLVNERPVQVRRLRDGESPRGLNLLFVGRADPGARNLLRAAQPLGVLTVTEGEHGLDIGAAISLVALDGRIGFDVSLENAERSSLRISSRMLAVARRVAPRA